jgi:hypothetical protein
MTLALQAADIDPVAATNKTVSGLKFYNPTPGCVISKQVAHQQHTTLGPGVTVTAVPPCAYCAAIGTYAALSA